MQLQASLDAGGTVVDWNHDVWSYGHSTRPRAGNAESGLLAAWHVTNAFDRQQPRVLGAYHFGSHRNADPLYDFSRWRVVRHEVLDSPLRISALRSLGAYANVFAIESFMDELAHAAGVDPLDFRLNHLSDERAKIVLETAAQKAGWRKRKRRDGHGWGLAFARYKNQKCYAAIIVRVDVESGTIRLSRVTIAADAGQVVNPDGLSNQLEGGFVQAASWTLMEQVQFDQHGVTSLDWESYPILRFPAAPVIETVILDRPEMPFLGSGEDRRRLRLPTPCSMPSAYDCARFRLRRKRFSDSNVVMRYCQVDANRLLHSRTTHAMPTAD